MIRFCEFLVLVVLLPSILAFAKEDGFQQCGLPSEHGKILGEMAELDEFPWAALLFYRDDYQGCGGVLISSKFVLTAAHCLAGNSYDTFGPLEYVRLGEYNTISDPDCVIVMDGQYKECNDEKIDARPLLIKVHPDYIPDSAQQYHDLGLIELDQEVPFTYSLSPICLPESKYQTIPKPSQTFSVCGWGRTNYFTNGSYQKSPIKMKASLPFVEPQVCEEIYQTQQLKLDPAGQLCAGGTRGQDACAGDGGSPLMFYDRRQSVWVLSGLVSRGPIICGQANKPGIFTNVKQYLPWIKANTQL